MMQRVTAALSFTGFVFAMHATAVKPPATAARGAGGDRLLVLAARLAQVHVHVDEAGGHPEPRRVDRGARAAALASVVTSTMRAVVDQHVRDRDPDRVPDRARDRR